MIAADAAEVAIVDAAEVTTAAGVGKWLIVAVTNELATVANVSFAGLVGSETLLELLVGFGLCMNSDVSVAARLALHPTTKSIIASPTPLAIRTCLEGGFADFEVPSAVIRLSSLSDQALLPAWLTVMACWYAAIRRGSCVLFFVFGQSFTLVVCELVAGDLLDELFLPSIV